jgi:purine/pyrimidine-nucleoside phosphorylase
MREVERMKKMTKIKNADIVKKANIYFDGKVTSRTIFLPDGTKKTLGIMMPGEYEFTTELKEEMDITAGQLEYKLQGGEWETIAGSGVFYVPANESFQLKAHTVVDYCCSYLAE